MEAHSTPPESRETPGDRPGGTDRHDSGAPTDRILSVVIVTYNEADRVGACVESVLRACGAGPPFEVFLVDSNSTDRTVDIAREYPISILQIPADDLTTPGAGRHVGAQAARGEYLLFVDGDMELTEGWLRRALALLDEHDDVAGVDGHLNESDAVGVEGVEMLHGVALYDAVAFEDVAGFDPHLRSLEDIELGYRLTLAGYRLLRLPDVVAHHPWDTGVGSVLLRWRNGYYVGLGQVVRKFHASPGILGKFLVRYRYPLLFNCWLVLGVAMAIVGVASGATVPLRSWGVLTATAVAAEVAWEGVVGTSRRVVEYALMPAGFVAGLVDPPRDPATFPLESVRTVEDATPILTGQPERPAAGGPEVARADGAELAPSSDASPAAQSEADGA